MPTLYTYRYVIMGLILVSCVGGYWIGRSLALETVPTEAPTSQAVVAPARPPVPTTVDTNPADSTTTSAGPLFIEELPDRPVSVEGS